MEEPASARWFDSFAQGRDPRSAHARHRLFAIFVIALCAVISGAEGWEDREEYGQADYRAGSRVRFGPSGQASDAAG